jgi:hypothetical protein
VGHLRIQGRTLSEREVVELREWIVARPDAHRTALSRELCELWNWRNAAGQIKDMAARTLLLKLERKGFIALPARRRPPGNAAKRSPVQCELFAPIAHTGALSTVQPLKIEAVTSTGSRRLLTAVLREHHYLGMGRPVGENLGYLIYSSGGPLLAAVWFGASAWKVIERDRFIGWSADQRERGLALIANQSRFLILPGVAVPHLASHILGLLSRRIAADWHSKYGHRIVMLESFVECDRFAGTCYRAANWRCVGVTAGRSRQDRFHQRRVPLKSVWLYPLQADWREVLLGSKTTS